MQDLKKQNYTSPRLLADIGGTNARFALETGPHCFEAVAVLACNEYATIQQALTAYLHSDAVQRVCRQPVLHAAIAIANPVNGDQISMTNHHWAFSIQTLRDALHLQTLLVVNDFTALAMALPYLENHQRVQIGGGQALPERVIGLIGPGTGLGVSGIVPAGKQWVPLSSEGGHVSFSPVDAAEVELLTVIWREFPHVSAERLISGMGLEIIYRALGELRGDTTDVDLSAADISRRAIDGSCARCRQTITHFCGMLGTAAGNLAMTLGATGGVYIGGGIVPRLGDLFLQSDFRQRFEAKGRFANYLADIPTFLITAEYPAFLGVSAILSEKLSLAECAAN
ncbi:glucokinase [Undibacterium sp. WLX3042]|uniref:glucokinase n=1 Tax=Undibacterium sp. WLX3042 TaxID=3412686 RepID=UPI003C2EE763